LLRGFLGSMCLRGLGSSWETSLDRLLETAHEEDFFKGFLTDFSKYLEKEYSKEYVQELFKEYLKYSF